jgi:lysine-specific demethylase/histidyl-hydroxylase NO66
LWQDAVPAGNDRAGDRLKGEGAMTSCRFLEKFALRSLILPVSKDDFRTRFWEQKPLTVHRGNPAFYDDLFTLQDFDDAIARSPSYVKLANATTKKNVAYRSETVKGLEATLEDMRAGGTLVLDQLHQHDPKLALLCRLLAAELGHRFQTNLYLTPPNGKGFSPHWDNHDVFILQVLGCKDWKIEKDRRAFPLGTETMPEEGRDLRGDLLTFTLEQGDLIYIPRGFVHAAECGTSPSLHITLGVSAQVIQDFLHVVIKAAVARDPGLRAALPLGFMNEPGESFARTALTALRRAADPKFLADIFDQYRDELVPTFPLDVSGQVADFFQTGSLAADDLVGPRRGLVYRIHPAEDSVRINCGARSITFAGFFHDALEFALTMPAYRIRELPGELEDEERIVFIERLIQEGLVTRKRDAGEQRP